MKRIAIALMPFVTAASAAVLISARMMGQPMTPNADVAAPAAVPVVVELFTSEGCSSCPSADAALRELETNQSLAGVEVIALGQHVDYWNRLGWKDPFSSAAFTERQRVYAQGFGEGSYTPQAVVNGRYEFVGSQKSKLAETVLKAAKAPRATVTLARAANGTLAVQVANVPAGTQAAEVLLALTESNLATQVGRGENSGRLLRHASIVRTLRALGTVAAGGTFAATAPLGLNGQWKTANLKAVVLVQEQGSRHIVGVASLPLASDNTTALNEVMAAPRTLNRRPPGVRRSLVHRALRRAGSWPVGARFGAALTLGAAGFALAPEELSVAGRAVMAWDGFALVSLALIWCVLATADAGHARAVAARESPGRVVAFVFVPVAVACSLSAVLLLLDTGMMPTLPLGVRALHVTLAVGGVASAWLLLHTVFTLRYAHLYYAEGAGGGLEFPAGSARPNYLDFAYFGFGIGMTAQTSDVSISGSGLRHTALLHGLISFVFNTAVVAVSISGLVSVL